MPEKNPPQNNKAHKHALKEEDHRLWAISTQDVRRIHPPDTVQKLPPIQGKITLETLRPPTHSAATTPPRPSQSSTQIDANLKKKMTRGDLDLDGKIDLHGLTLDQAHRQFMTFIKHHIHRGSRFLLVITGKGRNRESNGENSGDHDNRGVIRKNMPHWCNDSSLKPHILQTSPAHSRHGGTGATYILLRRQRTP